MLHRRVGVGRRPYFQFHHHRQDHDSFPDDPSLDLIGPNIITVSGTCHENVSLAQRDRLTIQVVAGHFATIENAATKAMSTAPDSTA